MVPGNLRVLRSNAAKNGVKMRSKWGKKQGILGCHGGQNEVFSGHFSLYTGEFALKKFGDLRETIPQIGILGYIFGVFLGKNDQFLAKKPLFFDAGGKKLTILWKSAKMTDFSGFSRFPGGPPGKWVKFWRCTGFSRGFFAVFCQSFGFFGVFGVPVIKEEKAIALRACDIIGLCLFMRNAMVPGNLRV